MKILLRLSSGLLFILSMSLSYGQGSSPVRWFFKADPVTGDELVLSIKAEVAPSWHLYSQFINEGGPQPTRIILDHPDAYTLLGKAEERGKQTTFYDPIYEMDITWYSDEVSFHQKIKMNQPVTFIKGKVEYMICNNSVCVPHKQEFSVSIGR